MGIQSRVSRLASVLGMHGRQARGLEHLTTFHLRLSPPARPVSYFAQLPYRGPADPPVLLMGSSSEVVGLSIATREDWRWQWSSNCRVFEI
jgi:hypothetical protein